MPRRNRRVVVDLRTVSGYELQSDIVPADFRLMVPEVKLSPRVSRFSLWQRRSASASRSEFHSKAQPEAAGDLNVLAREADVYPEWSRTFQGQPKSDAPIGLYT